MAVYLFFPLLSILSIIVDPFHCCRFFSERKSQEECPFIHYLEVATEQFVQLKFTLNLEPQYAILPRLGIFPARLCSLSCAFHLHTKRRYLQFLCFLFHSSDTYWQAIEKRKLSKSARRVMWSCNRYCGDPVPNSAAVVVVHTADSVGSILGSRICRAGEVRSLFSWRNWIRCTQISTCSSDSFLCLRANSSPAIIATTKITRTNAMTTGHFFLIQNPDTIFSVLCENK